MSMDTMQAQYRQEVPTSAAYSASTDLRYNDQQDMDPEGYYTNQPVSTKISSPRRKVQARWRLTLRSNSSILRSIETML